MKRKLFYCFMVCVFLTGCSYVGCGRIERMKDNAKYRSLTGKTGRLILFYKGENGIFRDYPEVEITYSSADTEGIWFKTKEENEKYFQGDALFEPK